jgi:hypothetical protein
MKKAIILLITLLFAVVGPLPAQIDSITFPVSLSSFEGNLVNNVTKLKWKTACYISYANFQIQKSSDGITFTTINNFSADRLRCQQPFEFIDSNYNSGNVFYRINAGDIDGHFYHSKIININNKQTDFKIISVYPTVINSNTIIVLSSPYDGNIILNIINPAGISVKHYNYNLRKGVSNFNLDFSNVSKGNYWITSIDVKGKKQTVAVIKQ